MRIGINVPGDLWKQVKEIDPEVNVSEVCREALRYYTGLSERAKAQAAADWVTEHGEMFSEKLGSPLVEPDWAAMGLEDACEWVAQVTRERWKQFIHESNFMRRQGRAEAEMVDIWSMEGSSGGLNRRLLGDESKAWFEQQYDLLDAYGLMANPHDKPREEYTRAWLGYVHEVRRKVEELQEAHRNQVMAERAERLQSFPKPEVPPQLRPNG